MHAIFSVLKGRGFWQQEKGFSLIEAAIVLAIIGVIISLALPLRLHQLAESRKTLTRQHQEAIFQSLGHYMIRIKALPCPADPSLPGGRKGWARAQCLRKSDAVGLLPFKDLGLPESMARDGYGRYFTYAIEPHLSFQEEPTDFSHYCRQRGGQLRVYDASGQSVGERPDGRLSATNFVAVILISHGENGYGAYTDRGEIFKPSLVVGAGERMNSEKAALSFAAYAYSTHPERPFRHIVKWVTRDNFLAHYAQRVCEEEKR